MTRLSPKSEALAYRIWGFARPLGWNCTLLEVAEALGVSVHRVGTIVRCKGWRRRFRAGARAATVDARMNGSDFGRETHGFGLCGLEALRDLDI